MASFELPTPLAPSLTPSTMPAAQVRQYSWHQYAVKDVSVKRREFVGKNKQANPVSTFLPQQDPLIMKAHLVQVVRKVGKSERSRGKKQLFSSPNYLSKSRERNMTSLVSTCQKLEEGNSACSVMRRPNNSDMNSFNHISRPTSGMCTHKNIVVKGKEELKFKSQAEVNCQNRGDVINSRVIIASPSSDVITRESSVNKPIAKKRLTKKRSLMLSEGNVKSLLGLSSQPFVLITFLLSLIISIGGLANVKLHGSKSFVGNSLESCKSRAASVRYNLREFLATVATINEGLCFCINTARILVNNKQLIGYARILRPRKRDEEAFLSQYLERARKLTRFNSTTRSHDFSNSLLWNVGTEYFGGKMFSHIYIPIRGLLYF